MTSVKRPGKSRERTIYTLTPAGADARRLWTVEPPSLPRIPQLPKLTCDDVEAELGTSKT